MSTEGVPRGTAIAIARGSGDTTLTSSAAGNPLPAALTPCNRRWKGRRSARIRVVAEGPIGQPGQSAVAAAIRRARNFNFYDDTVAAATDVDGTDGLKDSVIFTYAADVVRSHALRAEVAKGPAGGEAVLG